MAQIASAYIDGIIARMVARGARGSLAFTGGPPDTRPEPPSRPVHLYIHVPFCKQLCPYCSFHRLTFEERSARGFFAALRRELDLYAEMGYGFSSVYIGGGTPTILMDELLKTLGHLNERFSPGEISVETNPDRLDRDSLSSLAASGVRRVSVGVQSFSDRILSAVGRLEKYGSGERLASLIADSLGIVRTLNVDMIYDFPIQDEAMLDRDLETILSVMPDQVTFYPLMVSSATRAGMEAIMGRPTRRRSRLFHDMIEGSMESAYAPNSAWCYSRGGAEMIDEYVVGGDDYVGAGCGAIGLVNGAARVNTFSMDGYVDAVKNGRWPVVGRRVFTARELARYRLLMGLFGLRLEPAEFRRRFASPFWPLVGPEVLLLALAGGVRVHRGGLELTRRGRYYLVVMMREFFTAVDNFRDQARAVSGVS
jgi:coproporphyrinogen III oxidase-like Fe-S oxidoreductase